ncbi:MAG: UDP-N-acetylmuramoyl-L-alanine--D-glutamate ligase [Anaerolineae bacterium]|nr:MAG: UDP-N-acetylmuramoyl-L-alanine--D-glutamate ligase [Anaerolineae bacterium]
MAEMRFGGQQVTIVGLAREGTALARFLAERGATATATDQKPARALKGTLDALAGLPINYRLGGHPEEIFEADVVFLSPGVPFDSPVAQGARQRGIPLSSETRLFTRLCPAPIVGITGSSGKTTTTALVGEMLERSHPGRVWVGGNIGQPLIGHLDEIRPDDWVVMELSSFQLELFGPWDLGRRGHGPLFDPAGWSPPVAAILNVTPNHLDRHRTMEAYTAAKREIIAYQKPGDAAVLGFDNAVTRGLAADCPGRAIFFGTAGWKAAGLEGWGAFLDNDVIAVRLDGEARPVCRSGELRLRGQHNVENVLAACAIASAAGAGVKALRAAATTFEGLPHRLELVREFNGVRYYNDSIATSPERTIAALKSFGEPIVLLLGGRDKHLPWDDLARLTHRKARHAILFGEAAPIIQRAMQAVPGGCQVHLAATMEVATELAASLAQPGDMVLLSPGGTSFDAFQDFEERGERFKEKVKQLGERS